MVDRVQALLNVGADAELGSRSEHDPDLSGVELAAQLGLRGRPLVIVNEGNLMLRDSLGHEQALDFMVDGEPRPALVFSLDDRVGRDGWVIRRFCYLGRSRHNGFAVAIGFDSIIASRETQSGPICRPLRMFTDRFSHQAGSLPSRRSSSSSMASCR